MLDIRYFCCGDTHANNVTAYNTAHALFSATAPVIQTALVLSSTSTSSGSVGDLDILHDGRLRPAYYLAATAVVSMLTLTLAAPYCERRRRALGLPDICDSVIVTAVPVANDREVGCDDDDEDAMMISRSLK